MHDVCVPASVAGFLSSALLAGCMGGAGVGDPCVQDRIPEGGYHAAETYVENGSSDCVTRVCVVRGLHGDPRSSCTESCAGSDSVDRHVYCSCRCDDDGPAPPCACPAGYACEPAGQAGSFCVRLE